MKYGFTPERMLTYLGKYMNEWIEAYPKKIKPFDNWIDQYIEKKKSIAKKEIVKRRKQHCTYCRRPFDEEIIKTKDHIVPLSRGGLDRKENRIPCCYDCNQWKKDWSLRKWLLKVREEMTKIEIRKPYEKHTLGYIINAIKKQMDYIKKNSKMVSQYKT